MDECSICLFTFKDEYIKLYGLCKFSCSHQIHAVCCQELINHNKYLCPLCREPYNIISIIPPEKELLKETNSNSENKNDIISHKIHTQQVSVFDKIKKLVSCF